MQLALSTFSLPRPTYPMSPSFVYGAHARPPPDLLLHFLGVRISSDPKKRTDVSRHQPISNSQIHEPGNSGNKRGGFGHGGPGSPIFFFVVGLETPGGELCPFDYRSQTLPSWTSETDQLRCPVMLKTEEARSALDSGRWKWEGELSGLMRSRWPLNWV